MRPVHPRARLRAACLGWPLHSEAAFALEAASSEEHRRAGRNALEHGLETFVLRSGASLDVLESLRDDLWSDLWSTGPLAPRGGMNLSVYLRRHARDYLAADGARVVVRGVGEQPARVAEWREVSLVVPPDLLVAAFAAEHFEGEPTTDLPSLLPPHLRRWAAGQPLADTHLHLGTGLGHVGVWSRLMLDPRELMSADRTAASGALERRGIDEDRLHACALVRIALARALAISARGMVGPRWCDDVAAMVAVEAPMPRHEIASLANRAVDFLVGLGEAPPRAALRYAVKQLLWCAGPKGFEKIDPSGGPLALGYGAASVEVRLLARGLHAIGFGVADPRFVRAFNQYVRVRCQVYRFLVQEPDVEGLGWFQRFLGRSRTIQGARSRSVREVLEHDGGEVGLRALEVRMQPSGLINENLVSVRSVLEAMPTRAELGLTFHLTTSVRGKPTFRGARESLLHGAWTREKLAEAKSVARLLEAVPETLLVLRSIDLAGRELALPSWAPLGPLRLLRTAGDRASRALVRRHPSWGIHTLRATHHVGEEFLTLLQGLRRIDTLLRHELIRSGDRLGHALVLGVAAREWTERRSRVSIPLLERIEDLAFELERYRANDLPNVPAGRVTYIECELERLSECLFDVPVAASELVAWRRLLHEPDVLSAVGYPFRVEVPALTRSSNAIDLLRATLGDTAVAERGLQAVEFELHEQEGDAAAAIQDTLRRRIGQQEITIESNPTSNLLVAGELRTSRHGVLALRSGESPLAVTINTDNPLTHATRLEDELSYVYHAMLENGRSRIEAEASLRQAIQDAWRSRFTCEESQRQECIDALHRAFGSGRGAA